MKIVLVPYPECQGRGLERFSNAPKVSVLNISVCVMLYIGGGKCGMCWGTCCPLVNTVLKSLVDMGELDVDTEVSVYVP